MKTKPLLLVAFIAALTANCAQSAAAENDEVDTTQATTNAPAAKPSRMQMMIDPEDGNFDVSEWLGSTKGFLPVPIIITEPAVGYGGGVMLMFLHDSLNNRAKLVTERNPDGSPKRLPPPSISGVLGMATENGTWGIGAFHMGVWKGDTIRYTGALGRPSINYDTYVNDQAFPVSIEGVYLLQQMIHRLGNSDFFLGGNYELLSATAAPNFETGPSIDETRITSSGVSAILEYDSRDSIFTPDSGLSSKNKWTVYNDAIGSDNNFNSLSLKNRYWMPVHEAFTLGLRADGQFSSGDVPFYMLPYVDIRGIPAMRYQGAGAITTEAELRWDCTKRWSLIGFAGAGWTAENNISDFGQSETYPAVGFGFRYLIARAFKMRVGIDFGFSEVDQAFYITTGNAWF